MCYLRGIVGLESAAGAAASVLFHMLLVRAARATSGSDGLPVPLVSVRFCRLSRSYAHPVVHRAGIGLHKGGCHSLPSKGHARRPTLLPAGCPRVPRTCPRAPSTKLEVTVGELISARTAAAATEIVRDTSSAFGRAAQSRISAVASVGSIILRSDSGPASRDTKSWALSRRAHDDSMDLSQVRFGSSRSSLAQPRRAWS